MIDAFRDLFHHQSWADSEHWKTIDACAPALEDEKLKQTLNHIHMAQTGFIALLNNEKVDRETIFKPLATLAEIRQRAQENSIRAIEFADSLPQERLGETRSFPLGEMQASLLELAIQMTTHSIYHRGQTATRLRELGGDPPLTDYIIWLHKGRPAASW